MSENILVQQNRVIIALLARSTIGVKNIEGIVRGGKKKGHPDDFVRAYNALDGSTSVTDLAKMVGVTQPSMTVVLQTWEANGIVYKMGTSKQAPYVGLLKLPIKSDKRVSAKTKKKIKRIGHETVSKSSIQTEGAGNEERPDS